MLQRVGHNRETKHTHMLSIEIFFHFLTSKDYLPCCSSTQLLDSSVLAEDFSSKYSVSVLSNGIKWTRMSEMILVFGVLHDSHIIIVCQMSVSSRIARVTFILCAFIYLALETVNDQTSRVWCEQWGCLRNRDVVFSCLTLKLSYFWVGFSHVWISSISSLTDVALLHFL